MSRAASAAEYPAAAWTTWKLEPRLLAVVTLNVLTPGWMVVGIVTTRVLLMLTATGGADAADSAGAAVTIAVKRAGADEREARHDGTDLWNAHVHYPQYCTRGHPAVPSARVHLSHLPPAERLCQWECSARIPGRDPA